MSESRTLLKIERRVTEENRRTLDERSKKISTRFLQLHFFLLLRPSFFSYLKNKLSFATMAMLAGTDFSTSQFGGGGFMPS